jgi:hypothetical protein
LLKVKATGVARGWVELVWAAFLEFSLQDHMQAFTNDLRHGKELSIAIKFDGLDGGVVHHLAVGAFADMLVKDELQLFGEVAIEIG